jgi:hypothetical protein
MIPPEDRAAINSIKRNFEGKPLEEQLIALQKEVRSFMQGVYFRLGHLELENHLLRNEVSALKTGVRTSPERRDAMADYVEASGVGVDDA